MKYRKLGKLGPDVAEIGLGCMSMSDFYAPATEADGIATVHHALERGINFFDTADMYGPHTNEILVGKALRDRRDHAVIATKFGIMRDEQGQFVGINGRPDYVKSCCDASLKRLQVDHIDLYYQHRVDPDVAIEETVGAMRELVDAGKVRFLGLSEAAPQTIRRAHDTHPITALQTEYSLWSRDPEAELLDLCAELGIAFVAYSPLGRGFLTGAFQKFEDLAEDDWRRNNPRFQGENFEKNLALVKRIEQIAARKNVTAAQLAIAWVLAQRDHIIPIPGTKRKKYVDHNIAATDVPLTSEDLSQIEAIFPSDAIAGTRYPEAAMQSVNR